MNIVYDGAYRFRSTEGGQTPSMFLRRDPPRRTRWLTFGAYRFEVPAVLDRASIEDIADRVSGLALTEHARRLDAEFMYGKPGALLDHLRGPRIVDWLVGPV